MTDTPTWPGCRWCPTARHGHGQRWTPGIGWHPWTEPTRKQIAARLRARYHNTPSPGPTVADADALAEHAHQGQTDKAGRTYIGHVRAVAELLRSHGVAAVIAGLLHDIVEDTSVTLDDLTALGYPPHIVTAVDAVTRRNGETYMDLIRRAAADPLGRLVKLADNAHNSDPGRLALLDPEAREWFTVKYSKARKILMEALP